MENNKKTPVSYQRGFSHKRPSESEMRLLQGSHSSSSTFSDFDIESKKLSLQSFAYDESTDEGVFTSECETEAKGACGARRPSRPYELVAVSESSRRPAPVAIPASVRSGSTAAYSTCPTRACSVAEEDPYCQPDPPNIIQPLNNRCPVRQNWPDLGEFPVPPPWPRRLDPSSEPASAIVVSSPPRHAIATTPSASLPLPSKRLTGSCWLKPRFLLTLTGVSVVVGMASLLLLYLFFVGQSEHDLGHDVCVPCRKLRPNSDRNGNEDSKFNQMSRKGEGQKALCCAKTSNSSQMSSLVNLLLIGRSSSEFARNAQWKEDDCTTGRPGAGSPSPRTVSAHKALHPFDDSDLDSPPSFKGNALLTFKDNLAPQGRTLEHAHGVAVKKNRMIVLHSGWYLVYSSVYFSADLTKGDVCSQSWKHFIKRTSMQLGGVMNLTVAKVHCCENCKHFASTSYTGGVFCLQKGDEIFVEVSSKGLALDLEAGSFLGLVKVDGVLTHETSEADNTQTRHTD